MNITQRKENKKRVAFHTLGCKVNQYETEAMTGGFISKGYELVDFDDVADVYVINTCTVTNIGDRKSRQFIRRALEKNQNAFIAVVGCYSQIAPEKVMEIPGVNLIVGTDNRSNLVNMVEESFEKKEIVNCVKNIMDVNEYEDLGLTEYKGRTRAFVKIQDGCDNYCAYCIIPYARGHVRSRKPESIISEVKNLAENGFKEIVLTGIHIGSYAKDFNYEVKSEYEVKSGNDEFKLIDLIEAVHDISGIERIRIGSVEPGTLTDDFLNRIKNLPKLCRHFHLSMQSGSDDTLKRMNRKYLSRDYFETVKKLRDCLPNVAITTDVIVGFPGETEEEFQQTADFVRKISFSTVHVFKYSPRSGTPAAKFPNQISGDLKDKRSKIISDIAEASSLEYKKSFLNTVMKVLIEQRTETTDGKSIYHGLTDNYLEVAVELNVTNDSEYNAEGDIFKVYLEEIKGNQIIGRMIL